MAPQPYGLVYLHLFPGRDRLGVRPAFLAPRRAVTRPLETEETLSLLEAEIVAAARSRTHPGMPFPRPGDRIVLTTWEDCREQPAELAETVARGMHIFMALGWFVSPAEAAMAIAEVEEFLRPEAPGLAP